MQSLTTSSNSIHEHESVVPFSSEVQGLTTPTSKSKVQCLAIPSSTVSDVQGVRSQNSTHAKVQGLGCHHTVHAEAQGLGSESHDSNFAAGATADGSDCATVARDDDATAARDDAEITAARDDANFAGGDATVSTADAAASVAADASGMAAGNGQASGAALGIEIYEDGCICAQHSVQRAAMCGSVVDAKRRAQRRSERRSMRRVSKLALALGAMCSTLVLNACSSTDFAKTFQEFTGINLNQHAFDLKKQYLYSSYVYEDFVPALAHYYALNRTTFAVYAKESDSDMVQQNYAALADVMQQHGAAVCRTESTCGGSAVAVSTSVTSLDDNTMHMVNVYTDKLNLTRMYSPQAESMGPMSVMAQKKALYRSKLTKPNAYRAAVDFDELIKQQELEERRAKTLAATEDVFIDERAATTTANRGAAAAASVAPDKKANKKKPKRTKSVAAKTAPSTAPAAATAATATAATASAKTAASTQATATAPLAQASNSTVQTTAKVAGAVSTAPVGTSAQAIGSEQVAAKQSGSAAQAAAVRIMNMQPGSLASASAAASNAVSAMPAQQSTSVAVLNAGQHGNNQSSVPVNEAAKAMLAASAAMAPSASKRGVAVAASAASAGGTGVAGGADAAAAAAAASAAAAAAAEPAPAKRGALSEFFAKAMGIGSANAQSLDYFKEVIERHFAERKELDKTINHWVIEENLAERLDALGNPILEPYYNIDPEVHQHMLDVKEESYQDCKSSWYFDSLGQYQVLYDYDKEETKDVVKLKAEAEQARLQEQAKLAALAQAQVEEEARARALEDEANARIIYVAQAGDNGAITMVPKKVKPSEEQITMDTRGSIGSAMIASQVGGASAGVGASASGAVSLAATTAGDVRGHDALNHQSAKGVASFAVSPNGQVLAGAGDLSMGAGIGSGMVASLKAGSIASNEALAKRPVKLSMDEQNAIIDASYSYKPYSAEYYEKSAYANSLNAMRKQFSPELMARIEKQIDDAKAKYLSQKQRDTEAKQEAAKVKSGERQAASVSTARSDAKASVASASGRASGDAGWLIG